jgi:MHS family metabolite:H+ symporter-like MFS transporter
VAIWIRLKLKESPSFAKLEARSAVNDNPLKHLVQHSKPTLLKVIRTRMAENGGSSIYQSPAISYIATATGLKGQIGPYQPSSQAERRRSSAHPSSPGQRRTRVNARGRF